jgi:hypothetical protein
VEGGDDYIDKISAKELWANKPLVMSQLEIEYFDKNKWYNYSSSNSSFSISYFAFTSSFIL